MTGTRNLKMWLTMCSFLLALVSTAAGGTLHVPGDYSIIQAAIIAANDGDQIEVASGTYNEAINFLGKAVRLYSSGGAAATTINGTGNYHVIQCVSGEGPGTILEGFTITGGNAGTFPNNCGGGMYNNGTSPTVKSCTFTANSAASFGGGMYNYAGSATVTDCTFSNNEARVSGTTGQGGGIYNEASSPTVTRCTFTGNSAASFGGGMYNYFSNPTVTDCTFSNNQTTATLLATGQGGGMHNDNSSPTLTNCTFSGNTSAGALVEPGKGGGMYNYRSNPTLTACSFNANTASCSGSTLLAGQGGGMHNSNSSPTLNNCTFSANIAGPFSFGEKLGAGGGMYNGEGSSPKVTNCTFSDNTDSGMFNELWSSPTVTGCSFSGKTDGMLIGASSSPTVTNCTFSGNHTAGIWNQSSSNPKVTDCTFSGNWAGMQNEYLSSSTVTDCTFSGNVTAGIWNKASSSSTVTHCTFTSNNQGIWNELLTSSTVTNCTFTQNQHAGMENWSCNPTVTNCVFMNNWYGIENMFSGPKVTNCTFTGNYIGIDNTICGPKITNCILWNNTLVEIGEHATWTSVTYCDVQPDWGYYYPGTGNIYSDPKFADADGRLSADSPCIDAGNNDAVTVTTDLDGNSRIVDGDFDGNPRVDMGAYEAYEMLNIIHVPGDAATIQQAIDSAISYYSQIEVAPGTYNEAIDFKGKAIRLYSKGGPQVTTINGNGADHVVQCVTHERTSTILEGFTITGGNANGSAPHNRGGGMYNDGTAPTVTNCIFTGNTATYGGGMSNDNFSWPLITGCIFKSNSASNAGGGIANSENYGGKMTNCRFESNTASVSGGGVWNEYSNYQLTNCTFNGNRANALFGGGMHNELYSTVGLTNCTFSSNSAAQRGGGMDNYYGSKAFLTNCTFTGNSAQMVGGGIYNWSMQSEAILTNCTFTGNSVPSGSTGGAMGNLDGISKLTNCTFTGNLGYLGGGGIHNQSGSATLTNCILWGDSSPEIRGLATVTYSDVQGGWAGTGNKNANPLFADGAGRLAPTSPCIDAGNNAAVSGVATDLDGKPRITDGNLDGVLVVDMGAYEYVSVDADADGIKDSVDTAPLVYSNDFADGSTTGTIIDRADQLLVIADAPAPHGVWIEASASGGPTPAQVSVCGDADIWFDAGDGAFVTCGSVEITVAQGTVEIVFTATNGTQVVTSLNKGSGIAFEPETCTITAPATNVDNVVVIVNGGEIILAPGESKVVGKVDIDIYPNRTPNQVYLSRNYTLYVAILGSANFDVSTVDSSTVKFGQTGTEASPVRAPTMRDLNADGFIDAMYGFMTFNCGFQLGDTEGVLTGKTTAGIDVIGRDSVLVSP